MKKPTAVHTEYAALTRLDELGLKESFFTQAIRHAATYTVECTENSPPTERKFLLWSKTVGAFRDATAGNGWHRNKDNRCYPLTVHPEGLLAIAVANGNEQTGRMSGAKPQTNSPKGRSTKLAIDQNQQMFELGDVARINKRVGLPTWILLVHEDEAGDEIRMELSLPTNVNKDGYVDDWSERIVMAPHKVGNSDQKKAPEKSTQVDVEVRRRTG